MEPVTHFLTGACMGRSWFNRKTAFATLTMTLAAEAPDLDMVGYFKNSTFGFAHHRGFTHSFLGLVPMSLLVVGVVYLCWHLRGRKIKYPDCPPRWGLLLLFAYIAGVGHILLDYTNNYGVRPFWPFSERWYSWDIIFIVEPALLILLIGGLVLPSLFSLINEEIGARAKGPKGRWAATVALIGMVAVWSVRGYEHRKAVNALEARMYRNEYPVRASAYPYWWNPFHWYGVVETENFFATMQINSATPEVDPQDQMRIYYKPPETPATLAAKRSYLGRVYLDWAQYPLVEPQILPDSGYLVTFQDLRYAYPDRGGNALRASARLAPDLHVLHEGFGRGSPDHSLQDQARPGAQ